MANYYGNDLDNLRFGGSTDYYGGDGNDFMTGDAGANQLYGGEGNDILAGSDLVIYTGTGSAAAPFALTSFRPSGDDYIEGGAGRDVLYGADGNDSIFGGAGNASGVFSAFDGEFWIGGIYGGAGNDLTFGGSGDDLISGGAGNDVAYGGSGHSSIFGGAGNDTLMASTGAGFNLVEGEDGDDWIYLGSVNGNEAYGGAGNDVEIAGSGNAIEIGEAGNDALYGAAGQDYFYGGTGNDTMYGGAGIDVMLGGTGDDFFEGGTGVNYYFGGAGGGPGSGVGHDTFVLDTSGATLSVQVVQDWTEGLDKVQLAGSHFTSFSDLLAHSYQNGAYFVIQPEADNAVWLNGATASSLAASDFTIVS